MSDDIKLEPGWLKRDIDKAVERMTPPRAHEARTVSEPDWNRVAEAIWNGSHNVNVAIPSIEKALAAAYAQGLAARPLPAETVEAIREACADHIETYLTDEYGPDYGMASDEDRASTRRSNRAIIRYANSIRAVDLSRFTSQDAGEAEFP